jgi:hypothetical protein
MTARRTIAALALISAAVISLIAAQGAAAVKGTAVFTCKKTGEGGAFTKAHCAIADAGAGEYSHVSVPENTETHVSGINLTTSGTLDAAWKFKSTFGGVPIVIQAKEAALSGTILNTHNEVSGEHTAIGTATIAFHQATVTSPAKEGCVVNYDKLPGVGAEEMFETRQLAYGSPGQGDRLKFEPNGGTVLASLYIQGCANAKLNRTYNLTGTVKTSSLDGATMGFTEADTKTQNSLKIEGQLATIEGGMTLEGRDEKIEGDTFKPLSFTTVETP